MMVYHSVISSIKSKFMFGRGWILPGAVRIGSIPPRARHTAAIDRSESVF